MKKITPYCLLLGISLLVAGCASLQVAYSPDDLPRVPVELRHRVEANVSVDLSTPSLSQEVHLKPSNQHGPYEAVYVPIRFLAPITESVVGEMSKDHAAPSGRNVICRITSVDIDYRFVKDGALNRIVEVKAMMQVAVSDNGVALPAKIYDTGFQRAFWTRADVSGKAEFSMDGLSGAATYALHSVVCDMLKELVAAK